MSIEKLEEALLFLLRERIALDLSTNSFLSTPRIVRHSDVCNINNIIKTLIFFLSSTVFINGFNFFSFMTSLSNNSCLIRNILCFDLSFLPHLENTEKTRLRYWSVPIVYLGRVHLIVGSFTYLNDL